MIQHAIWTSLLVPALDATLYGSQRFACRLRVGQYSSEGPVVEEDVLSSSKRSSLQVIADILKIQGTKMAIMYRGNLSYAQTQKYLELLLRHELLEVVTDPRGKRRYQATEKGKRLIRLMETIESFAGGVHEYREEPEEEAGPGLRSAGAA